MIDAVAVIGDAGDINCWSGIPFHFVSAANSDGSTATPWRLDLGAAKLRRNWWNLQRVALGRGAGGYQYSTSFLDWAESTIPPSQWQGRIVTFNQHFPRGSKVAARGARLVHYVDATFASFCEPAGLAETLPQSVQEEACALELENYSFSERIVTMARWAAKSVTEQCSVPMEKVTTILPGANLSVPIDFPFSAPTGRPGKERPLRLGFVGKDWKRKGLPFLLKVQKALEQRGFAAMVKCAGHCPPEFSGERGLDHVGFIDKAREPERFLKFIADCDVGCLFSDHEPLGISTLEFLRAGVPVAGFTVEGLADTLPPDAGFRFAPGSTVSHVADVFEKTFSEEGTVHQLREGARAWSPLVTWERCLAEWQDLLETGVIRRPVQPWRGLAAHRSTLSAVRVSHGGEGVLF